MQFYLNGYSPGDPDIQTPAPGAEARPNTLPNTLPDTMDVLIVGTGPAGMLLAAQLAAFPGITTRIVDRRDGPSIDKAKYHACGYRGPGGRYRAVRRTAQEASLTGNPPSDAWMN